MHVLQNYVTDTDFNSFKQNKDETVDDKIISLLKNNPIERTLHNNVDNTEITWDNKFQVL